MEDYNGGSMEGYNGSYLDDYNGPYKDIIDLERPKHINDAFSAKHPSMRREDRAKIFSSFAALKGYEESIEEAAELNRNSGE